jgi:hypothetical protein
MTSERGADRGEPDPLPETLGLTKLREDENMDDLNARMDFDHVIEVMADGTVIDRPNLYAPELHDGALESSAPWSLLDGWSGQDRYSGPIMHASEFVGGGMARWILENPGVYVTLVDYPTDGDEPDGWAVATLDA